MVTTDMRATGQHSSLAVKASPVTPDKLPTKPGHALPQRSPTPFQLSSCPRMIVEKIQVSLIWKPVMALS